MEESCASGLNEKNDLELQAENHDEDEAGHAVEGQNRQVGVDDHHNDEDGERVCYICHEILLDKESRNGKYGILETCWHAFCWNCITKSRKTPKGKSCPVCSKRSENVFPSKMWPQTKEQKNGFTVTFMNYINNPEIKADDGEFFDMFGQDHVDLFRKNRTEEEFNAENHDDDSDDSDDSNEDNSDDSDSNDDGSDNSDDSDGDDSDGDGSNEDGSNEDGSDEDDSEDYDSDDSELIRWHEYANMGL